MPVPLLDLKRQYEPLARELEAAAVDVMRSGGYIGGPNVDQFEEELAAFCGAKRAVAISSGSDALLASLMAIDLQPGDEVITTPFTFFATAGAIVRLNARPVFVDIDETFNIDIDQVAGKINDKTKAIMPVDLYGQVPDYERLQKLACDHDLPIIEDAAQAIGATRNGQRAGTFGLTGCFSFYPTKNLSALGDAGAIVTNADEVADKLAVMRNHGMEPRYYHQFVGGNFRLDAIQCAALRIKLRHIDAWNASRKFAAQRYATLFQDAGLADRLALPTDTTDGGHVWHQYVIRTDRRDGLAAHLQSKQIGCAIFYPLGLHEQACFKNLGYQRGDFPRTEAAADQVLALPMFAEITPDEQAEVVEAIKAFFA
jgi:dTDP-4-amino-4,6-dideoxygalactose transaminase